MTNALGRPIGPLVLNADERPYIERKSSTFVWLDHYQSAAAHRQVR
jgi:hypothetical protein